MALHRLSSRDIASVVEYNNTVRVIVPATKLTDLESVCDAIRRLQPMSGTALFAGVSKGADEVRKFLGRDRVNRIVLLSDGLANVGPSSPHELGELGASLIREGISVTTIGLGNGYNEDLMSRLARRSDGNHYFAENSTDLAHIFRGELGDILTAVGQEVVVKINLADGIRPIRALGRDVEIAGQRAIATLSQIYSEQEKYILLEVEVPPTPAGEMRSVAAVEVSYANLQTRTADVLKSTVAARFSDSPEAIEKGCNKDVIIAAVEQLATITSKLAMKLRDEGKVSESRKVLQDNVKYLEENADKLKSDALKRYARVQEEDEKALDGTNYNARRKKMVEEQGRKESQQSGSGKRSAEN
jgi:Ca-activated chloride channel family protein